MGKRIVLIQGHPDPAGKRFGHALADAYALGARQAGHEVRSIDVAGLTFPLLRTHEDWKNGLLPEGLREAQQALFSADHLVFFFPLWLGTMPALLKGFLEQVLRIEAPHLPSNGDGAASRPLAGKSARVIVTMGMPALIFRFYFFSHGLRVLERNILAFCGARPVRSSVIGLVEGKLETRENWLSKMHALGSRAR